MPPDPESRGAVAPRCPARLALCGPWPIHSPRHGAARPLRETPQERGGKKALRFPPCGFAPAGLSTKGTRGKPSGRGLRANHYGRRTSDRDRKKRRSNNFLPENPIRADLAPALATARRLPAPAVA